MIIDQGSFQVSFDQLAFDGLIKSQGVRIKHFRAIPDPRGMQSRGDTRSAYGVRRSSDGYIYKEAGTCIAWFASNSKQIMAQPDSTVAHATAYITLPQRYDDGTPILLANYDRFYLCDIEVRTVTSQYLEATETGTDRLQFPALCVEHIIDSNGVEYSESDYQIDDKGNLTWVTQNRPGWNASLNRGIVYAVRYRYVPFFVINRLIHEIRVAQVTNPKTNKRMLERFPYQVEVLRESVFYDTNRGEDSSVQDDVRYQDTPNAGGPLYGRD